MTRTMNDETLLRLENAGELVQAGYNNPFLLHEPDKVWFVKQGSVDVFAVDLHQGEPQGSRRYLFTIQQHQCMFGLRMTNESEEMGFLAVGPFGTELIKLDKSRFHSILTTDNSLDDFVALIDQWIVNISKNLVIGLTPKKYIIMEFGKEFDADKNQIVRPKDGVVWLMHITGSSLFGGLESFPVYAESIFIPLTEDPWLVTSEENTSIVVLDTMTICSGEDFDETLTAFHRLALTFLKYKCTSRNQDDRERLRARIQQDHRMNQHALLNLASIIQKGPTPVTAPSDEEGPFFAACSLICEHLGIKPRLPATDMDETAGRDLLTDIAHASHFRFRRVMLREDWWRKDSGPLLGFIEDSNRPVALLPKDVTSYEMVDPVQRSRTLINRDSANTLSPEAYTFYRPFADKVLTGLDIVKFSFRNSKKDIVIILLMGVLGGLLGMVIPLATGIIFDSVIPGAEVNQLMQLTLALLMGTLATALFKITQGFAVLRITTGMDSSIQAALWDRLLKLPTPFFRRFSVGDLTVRALGFNQINQMLSGTTIAGLLSSVFAVFNYLLLFYYSPPLALIATGLVVVAIILTSVGGYFQLKYQRIMLEIMGKISGFVLQMINGIAKLRVAGAELRAYSVWAKKFAEMRRISFKAGTTANLLAVFNSFFPILGSIAIFAYLALVIMGSGKGEGLSTGEFLAFNAALALFLSAMIQLTNQIIMLMGIIPIFERTKPILETMPEVDESKTSPGELTGAIEVNRLLFKYNEDGPIILNDVSFTVEPGEFVALVGPSGSGKSTMLRLLLGFEKAQSGSIYYDAHNISDIDLRLLRNQLGVVLQNGRLMSGDIFSNIIGASKLTIEDAWEAAKMAGFDDDIHSMPMGMHTVIPEGGSTLSGGQRQRLLIARALVHKPRIIFFDEATSALDNKTQAIVSESLGKLDATRIVIAHRLSTVIHADAIYYIQNGVVVESGNYENLMKLNKRFADLAKRQLA